MNRIHWKKQRKFKLIVCLNIVTQLLNIENGLYDLIMLVFPNNLLHLFLIRKNVSSGQSAVVTITQQLAELLAIPSVWLVDSLGQDPVFHYRIIGQHGRPSLSTLLLPRERWNSYWSCIWISDQSPQIRPSGWSRVKQVTKDISLTT